MALVPLYAPVYDRARLSGLFCDISFGELVDEVGMTSGFQDAAVLFIGGALCIYWGQRLLRPFWVEPVTRWLLRRGQVAMAMRLRFGKRAH